MAIRRLKQTTPGRRGGSVADFVEVTRAEPEKAKEQLGWLRAGAEQAGRNPDDIRASVFTWTPPFEHEDQLVEEIQPYRELGFTDFIFPMPPEEQLDMMEKVSREVLPRLRKEG
jgi:hypothetical protein